MTQPLSNAIELNPPQQSYKRSFWDSLRGDRGIWTIILLLSLISLAAVYSSSSSLAFREGKTALFFLLKQSGFVVIGLAILYVCHRIPLGWYRKLAYVGLFVSIGLLVLVFTPLGKTLNDGTRWLSILGFSFHPAEIAKIALILYVAKVIEDRAFDTFEEFVVYLLLPVSVVCLLILWGSISAGIMLAGTVFIILVVAGISSKHLMKAIGIFIVGLTIVVTLSQTTKLFPRVDTAMKRIFTYANVEEKKGDSFQADQAKIAIASAGIVGKGPGNSTQRYILPHPYSDFIYATIVEEYGFLGGVAVLLLFLWLFYRTYRIAKQCTRTFSSLLAIGLGMLIIFQAMLHICVNVGLLPVTGQTLPMISLGGTSFVIMSTAFGMILAVSRTVDKKQAQETMEATS
ncbi:MAG: FtsW/RodA/SpoVE family cell cycle protein [Bacteroidales bacterium]|nr:FtsW/RodA/SpoVE family cell cycle protein [Bacteroidales bacterium]